MGWSASIGTWLLQVATPLGVPASNIMLFELKRVEEPASDAATSDALTSVALTSDAVTSDSVTDLTLK